MTWSERQLEILTEEQLDEDGRFMFYPDPPIECGQRERDVQTMVDAGEIHRCASCGCTEWTPCEGGCIWATENLCSRCV